MEKSFPNNYETNNIMAVLKQNSLESFSILFDNYAPMLFGLIKRMVINNTLSEVVFQKVFIEVWNRKESYDNSKERLFTWMYKIARSITIDFIRSGNIPHNTDKELLQTSIFGEKVEQFLISKVINKSHICCLEKDDKEIISLIYYKGFTLPEVANQLGISIEELSGKLIKVIESLK